MIGTAEQAPPAAIRLRAALGLGGAGALLVAAGPLLGVTDAAPAWNSAPLLAVLALLVVLPAGVLLARRRLEPAAAALVPPAAFALAGLLSDLRIATDPGRVVRPELYVTGIAEPVPGAGLWVLLAGRALLVVAGLLALPALRDEFPERPRYALSGFAGALAAAGLFTAPFTSRDIFIKPGGVADSQGLDLAGGLLRCAAALLLCLLAGALGAELRRAVLLATALTFAAAAVPWVVAPHAADSLGLAPGPVQVLVGAVVALGAIVPAKAPGDGAVALPGLRKLHLATAAFGALTGVTALAGALLPQLALPPALTAPDDYSARLLWPAGLVVLVLAAALRFTPRARPALAAALAAVPLAGLGALDSAYAATQVTSGSALAVSLGRIEPGAGAWLTAVSVVLAAVTAVLAVLAGAAERDETEEEPPAETPLPLVGALVTAGLLAVGAFALPVVEAPELTPIPLLDLRLGSWGLLLALATVLSALAVAAKARALAGAALLGGVALVLLTRVLEYPLTSARAEEAAPAPGLWLAAAATAAALAAAVASTARNR
ncbi:hypothetical protein [Actinosynnema pretiosum]|uniref:Uncharacterized protein n=1 Tax=Actinosynnema pretiosum TaxID=42197 RepID=A0A290ZE78_9PSEU|nr:hypothetical protein [Actinosynnema pretiosum]ATE57350.1 hypothetical protein CNX65_31945 [Actinosynnema pretiosum]